MILATLILIGCWLALGLAGAFVGGGAARIGDR